MMRRLGVACLMVLSQLQPVLAADPPPTPVLKAPMAGTNPCGGTQPVALRPIIATHTQPPYPAESQRLGEQGSTLLRVEVGPDGVVTGGSVITSSGYARLDEAALDFVKEKYRWEPMDCTRPVAVQMRIAWALHPNAAPPFDPALLAQVLRFVTADPSAYPETSAKVARMAFEVVIIKDDGTVGQVVQIKSSGDPAIDTKSADIARAHHWEAPQLDGKPIGGIAFAGVIWTPPGQKPPDPTELSRLLQLLAPMATPPKP